MASVGRHAGYNLLGAVVPLLLSLVTIPLYLHLIGPERWGILAIVWLMLTSQGLFDAGLARATAHRIAAQRDATAAERAETFWTATLVNPVLGLAGGLALYAAGRWYFAVGFEADERLRGEVLAALPWIVLAMPVATLSGSLSGALQGRERFAWLNTVAGVSTALIQLVPLAIAWLAGPRLPGLLAAIVLTKLAAGLVLGWLAWTETGRGFRPRLSTAALKDMLGFGGWVALTAITVLVLQTADRFILGATLGAIAVAHYSVSFGLLQRSQVLATSIASAYFPRWAAGDAALRRASGREATAALRLLLTPLLAAAIVLLEPFLVLWVGPDLGHEAAPVGRLLILAFWLISLAIIQINLNYAAKDARAVALAYAIEIPVHLILIVVLLDHFGLIGAGLALIVRCVLDLVLQGWFVRREWPEAGTVACFAALAGLVVITPMLNAALLPSAAAAAAAGLAAAAVAFAVTPSALRRRWAKERVNMVTIKRRIAR